MYVRTLPREIAARWIKPGDEVAMYEVEDGSGAVDLGQRDFCRTAEFVERFTSPDWWLVVDGPHAVKPPPAPGRETGDLKHSLGGWWSVEPSERGYVPYGLDHVGAHSFTIVPVRNNTIGAPRTYFAKEAEQFVIRERVKVDALEMMLDETAGSIASDAVALRLLIAEEPTEGQRAGAGSTVAGSAVAALREFIATHPIGTKVPAELDAAAQREMIGHEACDLDRQCSGGPYWCLLDPRWTEEMRRVPAGVIGEPLGRVVAESPAIDFRSERESDAS